MSERRPLPIAFVDLFDGLGTPELGYRSTAAALDGQHVAIRGYVVPAHGRSDRFLLVDAPGACPDCSPAPVPAVTLAGRPTPSADVDAVTIEGRLGVGYEVDADGEASFVRLSEIRVRPAS